ncbi:MAG: Long-chain-fatty-acid--CoA ligase [uncultured Acidimicrobiales bacterium]|uniref:Long-chain-fatty-acid--CoA ligase n=1 Tax=uncultured Acidimicrobiales bacterium TaxID=310071 RepID=A0A6J4HA19_9ACTN|nr:MAG: Long-chain-fatty-acid--CoA ligase [uncultured Acidimicrobiales bacterium]
MSNLAELIEGAAQAQDWSDRAALVIDGRTLSHEQVHDGAARAASVLAGIGVGRGDAVLLALADGAEFAWSFLGAVRLGALAVPVNPHLPPEDHRHLARDCKAALVVCDDDLSSHFGGPILLASALGSALALAARHPAVAVAADEPAYAQYTSGTTGIPRAAVHRHGDPLVYTRAFAEGAIDMSPDDVLLSVSKMHFAYGLGNSLFFPLLTGACSILHPRRPRPGDIAELVARHQATVLFAVPTFYANLLRHDTPAASFASLRVAVSAGERLTPSLAQRTADHLGCLVLDSLGSTEVGQAFAGGTLRRHRAHALGPALDPYEVAVRDEAGRDLGPGEVGTLWVRGPTVLVEYLGQPGATAAALQDGWLRTGDRASLDEDGFLSHHGRVDDMEMVGGITVAPQEIEELLSSHPAVSEVAVVAVADPEGASHLQAFVVPALGAPADDLTAAELLDLTRARLAAYKVPRSVHFLDGLPRTATGKLRRFVLRAGGLGPAPPRAGAPGVQVSLEADASR